ncbi:MAG: adenylosuccinate synthetase [Patescibacteria group bacterium]|nr:adenylosuccinate synthetase [Patescibacteria group bacterium]
MKEKINAFLKDVMTLAVVCYQFGDTGKGKLVDLFSSWADIIARGTGGANAGHTICLRGKEYIFNLLPSGILKDSEGKLNIMGSGMVISLIKLSRELRLVHENGYTTNNLKISHRAKLVLPFHIIVDRLKELSLCKGDKIGTTGKGITPAYLSHYAREGVVMNDLLNPDIFVEKVRKMANEAIEMASKAKRDDFFKIMVSPDLDNGIFYHPKKLIDVDMVIKKYLGYAKDIARYICDTDSIMRNSVGKSKILLEGAQGVLLSIDYGTYPYVTSSDSSAEGLAKGVGLKHSDIDLELGLIKGFYMTRVGCGPFTSEAGGEESAELCNNVFKPEEFRREEEAIIEKFFKNGNSVSELMVGRLLRISGGEYGATTKRPRRIGWLDLPLLRYVMEVTGNKNLVLTKLDVLNVLNQIGGEPLRVCYKYRYEGEKPYNYGEVIVKKGQVIKVAIPDPKFLEQCEPIYDSFEVWSEDISKIDSSDHLPINLKILLIYLKRETGANIRILSVGREADQTIFM